MNSIEEEVKELPLDDPYGLNELKPSRSLNHPKMRFSSSRQHASPLKTLPLDANFAGKYHYSGRFKRQRQSEVADLYFENL